MRKAIEDVYKYIAKFARRAQSRPCERYTNTGRADILRGNANPKKRRHSTFDKGPRWDYGRRD